MKTKRHLSNTKTSSQRKKQLHRQQIKMVNRRQFYFNQTILAESLDVNHQKMFVNAD